MATPTSKESCVRDFMAYAEQFAEALAEAFPNCEGRAR